MTLGRWIGVALLVVVGLACFNRVELMLSAIEVAMSIRLDVGPNQPIDWDSGPDGEGRGPADRPPNIVRGYLSAVRTEASDQAILSDVRQVVHSGTVNGRACMFGRNRTNCAKSGFRFGNV